MARRKSAYDCMVSHSLLLNFKIHGFWIQGKTGPVHGRRPHGAETTLKNSAAPFLQEKMSSKDPACYGPSSPSSDHTPVFVPSTVELPFPSAHDYADFFGTSVFLCDEPSARPTLHLPCPQVEWSYPVTVIDLMSSVSLVAELALRRFFHVVVRFVWKPFTRTVEFDEQLDEVTLDLGADVESFDWDQVHQAIDINHDTFFTWDGCSVHSVEAVLGVFRVINEHVPAAVLIIFETPHVVRGAPSLVAAGLSSCCLNEVGPLLWGRAGPHLLGLQVTQCGDWVWSTTTSSTRLTSAPSRFRPAWLLEGLVGRFPGARRDLRAMVLTSAQGYKRSLLSWEVEAFLGFEHGVSACMLKLADAELMKSTAISLEAAKEMRTQALFEVWHCDSLEAVLAGIFGFSRPGPLLASSTTLERTLLFPGSMGAGRGWAVLAFRGVHG